MQLCLERAVIKFHELQYNLLVHPHVYAKDCQYHYQLVTYLHELSILLYLGISSVFGAR